MIEVYLPAHVVIHILCPSVCMSVEELATVSILLLELIIEVIYQVLGEI